MSVDDNNQKNGWGYGAHVSEFSPDQLAATATRAVEAVTALVPSDALNHIRAEALELQKLIPAEFANMLNHPGLNDFQKIDLAKELIRFNQSPAITDAQVAAANPLIRDGVRLLKEDKDRAAVATKEIVNVIAAPMAALASIAAVTLSTTSSHSPHGIASIEAELAVARESSRGPYLDHVQQYGPTKGIPQPEPSRGHEITRR